MCQILARQGWILVRTKGAHHAFQKLGNPATVIVPVHGNKDLKPGTQRAIMKDAELTDDDF